MWPALVFIKAPHCEENQLAKYEYQAVGSSASADEIEMYLRCAQSKSRHENSLLFHWNETMFLAKGRNSEKKIHGVGEV